MPRIPGSPRFYALAFLLVFLVAATGCRRTTAVHDVMNAPITSAHHLKADAVKKAILMAGNKRGWIMKPMAQGHILATLNVRTHQAVVDITYTDTSYSIHYKDSSNLYYDAGKKKIHRNYNGWIKNLDQQIQIELNSL